MKKLQAKSYKLKAAAGFSLVEVLVSIGLFSVIVVVALGSVVTAGDLARRSGKQRTIMDNLDFALENISRRVRVGHSYFCDSGSDFSAPSAPPAPPTLAPRRDCPTNPGNILVFQSSATERTKFYYDQSQKSIFIIKTGQTSPGRLTFNDPNFGVNISDVDFYVSGATTANEQPRVLVVIAGDIPSKEGPITFNLQTTLTQRRLDD